MAHSITLFLKCVIFILALVASSVAKIAIAGHHSETTRPDDPSDQPHFVLPDAQIYLDRLSANPRPALTREMLAMIRNIPREKMVSTDDLPVGELATIEDVTMPGPAGQIQLRLFDARAERAPGPVVVFFHGGAYVVGSIETHAGLAAEIARQLDLPVISVEYRLAPEHPWPAAVDDGEAAARWIAQNGQRFGRDFTGLVISGDSAGGNLTLVTTASLMANPTTIPVLMQMPIYPATDRSRKYPSSTLFSKGYGLDISDDDEDFYAADPNSVRASPLLGSLSGMPPTVMVTASLDPLRDQGRAYAAKLVEAGVPTVYFEAEGLIHGFATYRKAIPSAQQATEYFLGHALEILKNTTDGPQASDF